ncbi:MAG: sialidase family protein, partial [Candidatus Thermoplasmatota archaeon]|nr:sialidase family protein [Candidatus Thermoplasmatota archaeon]
AELAGTVSDDGRPDGSVLFLEWEQVEGPPAPSEEGTSFQAYWVPVTDEAGNLWIVYDWRIDGEDAYHVYAAKRDTAGTWSDPIRVSPEEGTHHLPWPAAGREGTLVLAWYGTLEDEAHPNEADEGAVWHVFAAATIDGTSDAPSFQVTLADERPVHEGPMDRKLLDFLQVDIGPEGAAHIAYAQDRDGQPDEATEYVRSTLGLDLARQAFPYGP